MRSMHQQQTTCGLQVCQHPLCWETNRQAVRGLLYVQQRRTGDKKAAKEKLYEGRTSPRLIEHNESEMEDDAFGLPTVTILNMIEDYGVSARDIIGSGMIKLDDSSREGVENSSQTMEKTAHIPKLGLKSLASMSIDDVMAPANTPLHSYHDFEDTDHYGSDTSHRRFKTQRLKQFSNSKVQSPPRKYGKVLLQIGDTSTKRLAPKKMLVWCPSLKSKRQQVLETIREKQSSMKRVDLPLNSVPAYNLTLMSHKAIKGMVCKKNRQPHVSKLKEIKDIVTVPQPGQVSRITPQEIELLRRVPLDVLIRVLNQAEENKVITKNQSRYLLSQVGKKVQLPPIVKKNTTEVSSSNEKEQKLDDEETTKTLLKTNPVKILDLEYSHSASDRIATAAPSCRVEVAAAIRQSEFNSSRTAPPSTRAMAEDSRYNKKLRSIANETLQSVMDDRALRKRTPVKYIATLYDENMPKSTVKPFHYKQSSRDIFLGPVPSPPPPSPPTERDSMYDPQLGGSTVMANPSLNEPSTIASLDDKKISPRLSKTPLSATADDIRHAKMTQTSRSQIHDIPVISPFDSSFGGEGWPQVNEDDFFEEEQSSDYMSSPMPSYIENDVRSLPRHDSTEPINNDPELAEREKVTSPVPPPPSPEPVSGNKVPEQDTNAETRRIMGAATALGLVALPAKTSLETTPETEPGITPTPVVSSVRSDEGINSRVATASLTADHMTIAETPFENGEENEPKLSDKVDDSVNVTNFEEDLSPEAARAELEEEVKKLDIS